MPSPHHAEMTFDDLPTLQDAFRTCDRDLLVRVVMADQVQGSFPAETVGKKQRHAMEKRILTSLDAMCSLKVKRKGGKRRLLLYPEESFSLDGRTGMIKRRLSASLFDLRHIESVKKAREALGSYAYAYKQVKRISKDKRKRAKPRSWSRRHTPWCRGKRCLPIASGCRDPCVCANATWCSPAPSGK